MQKLKLWFVTVSLLVYVNISFGNDKSNNSIQFQVKPKHTSIPSLEQKSILVWLLPLKNWDIKLLPTQFDIIIPLYKTTLLNTNINFNLQIPIYITTND